jgi:hypothetical protein
MYMYIHICVYIDLHRHIDMYTCNIAHILSDGTTLPPSGPYIDVYIYTYIYVYMYIFTHIYYIFIFIYIYMFIPSRSWIEGGKEHVFC